MKSTDSTWAIPELINCPMALYGAIETLHDTEQNRTHPSRNILRDRLLKVNITTPMVLLFLCPFVQMEVMSVCVLLQLFFFFTSVYPIHFFKATFLLEPQQTSIFFCVTKISSAAYSSAYSIVFTSLFSLSFLRYLPMRGSGSRRDLSIFLHSSLMCQAFRSLLTVSFHLNFGLPLGRFPSIFNSTTARMFSVSSLLSMCLNHSNLLLLMTITISSTFASSKIDSFLPCSSRLRPIVNFFTILFITFVHRSKLSWCVCQW